LHYALRSLEFAPFTFCLPPFAFILPAAVRNRALCSLRSALRSLRSAICTLRLFPLSLILSPFAFILNFQHTTSNSQHTAAKPPCPLSFYLFPFSFILFTFCLFPAFAFAAQVTLAWDRNTETDIAGYRLYYGTASRVYTTRIDAGNTDQYTVTGLAAGVTYYFAATAYDVDGNESAFSEQVVDTIPVISHTITVLAGDNGRITPAGPVTVTEGTNQTFSIHPDENYQILNVIVDGVSLGAVSSYTFRNILDDHTIEALFVQADPPPPADQDGDGVPDDQDRFPNDPNESVDTDGDGLGNNADPDDDNDGMPDDWEIMYGLDPLTDDASLDPDGDGITNLNEYLGGTAPETFDENSEPDRPRLLFPSNNEVVALPVVLQAETFSDPDGADFQAASQWQIFRMDDHFCVFDKTSDHALTSLPVPKLVLDDDTAYEWQVRYIDNHGLVSAWSETGGFTTELNSADVDGNGIPDNQEVDATIDLDEDGTPDNFQNDIKSVNVEGETTQIGISIRDADTVQSIAAVETENPTDHQPAVLALDEQTDFPFGYISFKLIVDNPGAVVVTLYLSRPAPVDGTWLKYDPVEDIWDDCSEYTAFSADRKSVYLTLTDGGFGDADGIENGIIVDPLGLGVTASAAPGEASAGGGGGGGCFISASAGNIEKIGSAAIRQKLSGLAIVVMLLPALFILARGLKKSISHIVR
jgi:chitinase